MSKLAIVTTTLLAIRPERLDRGWRSENLAPDQVGPPASVSRQRRRSVLSVRQSRSQYGGLLRHGLLRKTSGFRQVFMSSLA
jgi:hypothetical protein